MFDPLTAAIAGGAALVSGGISLWGANQQASAAEKAANLQSEASRYATDAQMRMFQQQQATMQPYVQAGQQALGKLSNLAGNQNINMKDYQSMKNRMLSPFSFNTAGENVDPSYKWRLESGLGAVETSAAAKGGFFSGETGLALQEAGQQAASEEYQNQFNRYLLDKNFDLNAYQAAWNRGMAENQNIYNQYAGLANMGMGVSGQLGQMGMDTAQIAGRNAINAAIGQGEGLQTGANAWVGAGRNIANQVQNLAGQYLSYNAMGNSGGLDSLAMPPSATNWNMPSMQEAMQYGRRPTVYSGLGG